VGEEAIEDQRVYADDGSGRQNHVDAEPEDGDALLDGEGVVESVVFKREMLVKRRDLVDGGEEANEQTCGLLEGAQLGRWSCASVGGFSYTMIR
jgi:hypothetical protein